MTKARYGDGWMHGMWVCLGITWMKNAQDMDAWWVGLAVASAFGMFTLHALWLIKRGEAR